MIGRIEDKEKPLTQVRKLPLLAKDEMNLIEFPFGPITPNGDKTHIVEHRVWDRVLKRNVQRRLLITGSDAFGLPKPIDDQVIVGMKALTYASGYRSRKVDFSRYELCQVIGWQPDGRAYSRLEESLDRIAGTTLKFHDAWWDKAEKEWTSKTFHLIGDVNLCSRDQLERRRARTDCVSLKLCSFKWSDVIWKSFQDGFIKNLDMALFRRIAKGRKRDVPLRLFRILDKRFHYGPVAEFDLRRLCVGTLGLCQSYSPSQMMRILERAAKWLSDCGFLDAIWKENGKKVCFRQHTKQKQQPVNRRRRLLGKASHESVATMESADGLKLWLSGQSEETLLSRERVALDAGYGSKFERDLIIEKRANGIPFMESGRTRQAYIRRFIEQPNNPSTC